MNSIPIEIGRSGEYDVRIRWRDGHESIYVARDLRLHCACAECVEEMTGKKRLNESRIPQDVHPLKISLVGNYAIHIDWSDGHRTGLYTFDLLRQVG